MRRLKGMNSLYNHKKRRSVKTNLITELRRQVDKRKTLELLFW